LLIGWPPFDPNNDNALKVSVDINDQFCATFGFKHTRIKKSFWSGKVKCTDTEIKTGLFVCVK